MKHMKTILSLLTALTMSLSLPVVGAAKEESATEVVMTDDFESYLIDAETISTTVDGEAVYNLPKASKKLITHELNSDGETVDSTNWYGAGRYFGADSEARAGVMQDPAALASNKVLAVETRVAYKDWWGKPRVIYQNLAVNSGDKYTYKFDFYKGSDRAGAGIVFNWDGGKDTKVGECNWYALEFQNTGDHAYGESEGWEERYSTVIVKNSEVQRDAIINTTDKDRILYAGVYNNDLLDHEKWYSVELSVYKGKIEWTVFNRANGTVAQTGSWTDPSPIMSQPTSFALLAAGQYNNYTYFDNVSVEKTTVEEDEEESSQNTIINDDFEDYAEVYNTEDYTIGADKPVAGNWYNRTLNGFKFGGWSHDEVGTAVIPNPNGTGKVLTINAQTGWEPTSKGNQRPAAPSVEYSAVTMNQDDVYTYTFDIYRNSYPNNYDNAGGGIRFSFGGTSFYELYFMGNHGATDGTMKTQLSKVENAEWTVLKPQITSLLTDNKLLKRKWFTVSLIYGQGNISWTVVDKESGATVQTGRYVDETPFTGDNFTMRLFAAGQGGEQVSFDNVSVTEEPANMIKLYSGKGDTKKSAKYISAGTMTVSGFALKAGNTLYAARYNSAGKLVEIVPTVLPAATWTDAVLENVSDTDKIKGFIWNSTTFAPVIDSPTFDNPTIKSYDITYPSYTKKAVTFNINDAKATDEDVIELMHSYGINATFGLTGDEEDYAKYVHDDFEIANHSTHIEMYLTDEYTDDNGNTVKMPGYDECVTSIETAENAITTGAGATPKGFAWPYFAPTERTFCNQLKNYIGTNGYEYIRDSRVTSSFDLPTDWLDWGITAWVQKDSTDEIIALADSYKELDAEDFKVMSLAGNGEDMTKSELIGFYTSLFEKLSDADIWKATNIEIASYIKACNELEITGGYIFNPTDITISMIVNGEQWVAEPNSYAHSIINE